MKRSATIYYRRLLELLLGMEVTDRAGDRHAVDDAIERTVDLVLRRGHLGREPGAKPSGKLVLVGNGGSAAIVSHLQNDIVKMIGARALVFNEPPLLTAIANDHGYEHAFPKLASIWIDAGDLLIAVSSSGRSPNIVRAATVARERSAEVVTLSGFNPDNPLRRLGDLNFYVASGSYGEVELAHMAIGHSVMDAAAAAGGAAAKAFWSETTG